MLNKNMIKFFLEKTNLSEPELPATWKDVIVPNDILLENTTNIQQLCKALDEDQRRDLFKTLILAWLFEMPALTNFSWGWYTTSAESNYRLTPIIYAEEERKFGKYTIKGAYYTPANMILFLEDKSVYVELLTAVLNCCEQFCDEFRTYLCYEPVQIQVDFNSTIFWKMQEIREAISMVEVAE